MELMRRIRGKVEMVGMIWLDGFGCLLVIVFMLDLTFVIYFIYL